MSTIKQNFEIQKQRIIFRGTELPVRPGITPAYLPEARSNPMAGRPRWLKASLLNINQAIDELYQKRNRIA